MRAARCWGEDPETRGWNNEGEVGVTEGTGHRTMRTGQTMGGEGRGRESFGSGGLSKREK